MSQTDLKAAVLEITEIATRYGLSGSMVLVDKEADNAARVNFMDAVNTVLHKGEDGVYAVDARALEVIKKGVLDDPAMMVRVFHTMSILNALRDESVKNLDMLLDICRITDKVEDALKDLLP